MFLESSDTTQLVGNLLDELLSLVPADIAVWFGANKIQNARIITRFELKSHDQLPIDHKAIIGTPCFKGTVFDDNPNLRKQRLGQWTIDKPQNRHANHFSTFGEDYTLKVVGELAVNPDHLTAYQFIYGPAEVGDQLRALMYQGRRLLGWFGVYRRGFGERFTKQEQDILNAKVSSFKATMSAIETFSQSQRPDSITHIIFDAQKRMSWASPELVPWLNEQRISRLKDGLKAGHFVLDGIGISIIPMHLPGHGFEWLVTLEPARYFERSALYGLSEHTHLVALLLTKGFSVQNIATELDCDLKTVRNHVNILHRRFGTSSLVRLALALSPHLIKPCQ